MKFFVAVQVKGRVVIRSILVFLLWFSCTTFLPSVGYTASEGTILTLWPAVDYRSAAQDSYSSVALAGPFVRYEKTNKRSRFGLRPIYYRESDGHGAVESDFLYPLMSSRSSEKGGEFQVLHLLSIDHSIDEGSSFTLFPLIFSRNPPQGEGYFAIFPIGGKILDRFGRDRIEFALFPLYSKTERKGTETTNFLWPIFSLTRGENEHGWAFWPLYGTAEKEGTYRRNFLLWPFFFLADEGIDTPYPLHTRAFFPFFHFADSSVRIDHTYLWPFFRHIDDAHNDLEEWDFPWPIFRVIDGKDRQMRRFLPFYSDDRDSKFHSRWLMWPIYKEEESFTPSFTSQRERVLYFLYSHTQEQFAGDTRPYRSRMDLWPLFTYEIKDGVSRFSTFAFLEPFFPGNEQIERNWSPLWHIYQRRWDQDGNEASTLLWNLYWKEKRGDALIFEVFPFVYYRNEGFQQPLEVSLLKGLYRYKRTTDQVCSYLFYLPWGWCRSPQDLTPEKESL